MEQEIKITITIGADENDFNVAELKRDINYRFSEITGYDIENIEIKQVDK